MPQVIVGGVEESDNFLKEGNNLFGNVASPLRYWEIGPIFRSPVISHCLTLAEQVRLLKKCGLPWKKMSPFQIHSALVESGEEETCLSGGIDRALGRKFERQAAQLRQMPVGQFISHWGSSFESGRYSAELWVAATHRGLPPEKRRAIFGSIYMEMHSTADRLASARRFAEHLKKENLLNRERAAFFKSRCKELEQSAASISRELSEERKRGVSAEEDKEALREKLELLGKERIVKGLRAENENLRTRCLVQRERLRALDEAYGELEKLAASLEGELKNERKANQQIEDELRKTERRLSSRCHCEGTCPIFDLCRKRILIVGGITRMEPFYREVVEANGGIFDYHDGGMNGKANGLECSLKRADLVLCPVNCNSHAACLLVKRLGKKYGKPIYMMPNFSMNAVTQKLAGLSPAVMSDVKVV